VSDATQYSVNDITRVFGSWQNALNSAGIDNKSRLIEDLRHLADELGRQPTTTEMNEHGHVSATTYATYFGTYTDAIEQAFGGTESTHSSADTTTTNNPDIAQSNDDEETSDDGVLGDIMSDFDNLEGSDP